jgi:kumamolisin
VITFFKDHTLQRITKNNVDAYIKVYSGTLAILDTTIGPAGALRDITSGNNDTDGLLDGQFQAGPGWDVCTGWGAPDGIKLLAALKSPTS